MTDKKKEPYAAPGRNNIQLTVNVTHYSEFVKTEFYSYVISVFIISWKSV